MLNSAYFEELNNKKKTIHFYLIPDIIILFKIMLTLLYKVNDA